jgi:hypothetical protein
LAQLSTPQPTAVNIEDGTVEMVRIAGSQKKADAGNVRRTAPTVFRNTFQDRPVASGILAQARVFSVAMQPGVFIAPSASVAPRPAKGKDRKILRGQFSANIPVGGRFKVVGICSLDRSWTGLTSGLSQPRMFQIVLRSLDDLTLISPPPWWTRQRIIRALTVTVGIVMLACAGIMLVAGRAI